MRVALSPYAPIVGGSTTEQLRRKQLRQKRETIENFYGKSRQGICTSEADLIGDTRPISTLTNARLEIPDLKFNHFVITLLMNSAQQS
jgi:hypothetical protein